MRHLMATLLIAGVLAPALAMADDKNAAQRIASGLRDSGKLSGYSIGVKYNEGTAWLNGQVTDKKQMATAIALAKRQAGVKKVVNNLKIGAPQPTQSPVQPASASSPITAQPGMPRIPMQAGMPGGRPGMPGVPMQAAMMAGGRPGMPGGPMQAAAMSGGGPGMPGPAAYGQGGYGQGAMPIPSYVQGAGGAAQAHYDQPQLPNYAWPSYAASPNYAALTYPQQYSATAWPYIGPFYPYPQVPLGWRKVSLEWDDGWWHLDFRDRH